MKNLFLALLISLIGSSLSSQQIHMFRTIYFPAEPFGGKEGLEEFVKQEMVYPDEALEEEIEGDVFITYKIDPRGKVKYKKVEDSNLPLMEEEASRIFDKIMWEEDLSRVENQLGYEKLKISFDLKKYKRLVRKRGYHHLPYDSLLKISDRHQPYGINAVDQRPQITNAKSVDQLVRENFKYPSIALQRGISGRVTVEMVIEPYGLVSNVRVVEAVAGGCNEETIRLVKMMKWDPGIKDGEAVRTLYQYQLNFINPGGEIR